MIKDAMTEHTQSNAAMQGETGLSNCLLGEGRSMLLQTLLTEWTSLRTEAIERTNNMYQLIVGAAAVLLWLVSAQIDVRWWLAVVVFVVAALGLGFLIIQDLTQLRERNIRIERDVNLLVGAEVFEWETRWFRKMGSPTRRSPLDLHTIETLLAKEDSGPQLKR